ncbi:MAG: glycoside hydrolase family 28 protein [Chitinophagaceae bacterium]
MTRLQSSAILLSIFILFTQIPVCAQSLPVIKHVQFKKDSFNIVKYGAVPGGIALNTKCINAAIAACNKKGGGTVIIPAGLWLSGPIVLKTNTNLYLADNALLQFTTDFNEYALVEGNWEGVPAVRNQSPLSASNAENIAITGNGIIDGGGDAWRAVKKEKLTESQWKRLTVSGGLVSEDKKTWYPTEKSFKGFQTKDAGILKDGKTAKDFEDIKDFLRPNLLVLTKCKKILLEGVTFQNSPAWCLHPLMCEDLTVRKVYVKNPWYAQNGDGIDIESCKNVLLENNTFDVGDDGICIKSGRDAEGRKRAMPTENVIVRKCIVYHAHGGFVIGSEMSGGARNLFVSDCSFIGTDIGLRFKTTRGRGGVIEKIYIRNINMKDIAREAILFDMYYMAKDPVPLAGEKRELPKTEFKPVDETTPVFKDFHISNVYCSSAAKAIFIRGLPEMHVKDIVLEDMVLQADKGIDIQEAENIQFKNITVIAADNNPVIDLVQSNHILFDNIICKKGAEVLLRASGDRVKKINVINTGTSAIKEKSVTELGADVNEIKFTVRGGR